MLVRIEDLLSDAVSVKRLSAIKQALHTRGGQPTKLQVQWAAAEDSAVHGTLSYVLGALAEGSQHLTALELGGPDSHATTLPTSLLAAVARSCPNLQVLTMWCRVKTMPPPQLFPHLIELHVTDWTGNKADAARLLPTISPYLTQLHSLEFSVQNPVKKPLPSASCPFLLPPTLRANHLRQLVVDVKLNDAVLGLLLASAPALEVLSVRAIDLRNDTHTQATTQWRELRCPGLTLSSLINLPKAVVGMKLAVRILVCDLVEAQDEATVVQALERMVLVPKDQEIMIAPFPTISIEAQPAALRFGLEVLRCHAAPSSGSEPRTLLLAEWTMSAPLMLELRQLPLYKTLKLRNITWLPDPKLYSTLLRLLPSSYSTVTFDQPTGGTLAEYICLGAPVTRTAADPFHIVFRNDPDMILALQQRMQELGVFPGVVISQMVA